MPKVSAKEILVEFRVHVLLKLRGILPGVLVLGVANPFDTELKLALKTSMVPKGLNMKVLVIVDHDGRRRGRVLGS